MKSITRLFLETIHRNEDAEFIGYQETRISKPIALYNVLDSKSPKFKSTVTAETLKKLGLKVPETPSIEQWKKERKIYEYSSNNLKFKKYKEKVESILSKTKTGKEALKHIDEVYIRYIKIAMKKNITPENVAEYIDNHWNSY